MDPYERMEQLVEELTEKHPEATVLLEATRQSIFHPASSLVSLTLFVVRDKTKMGEELTITLIYLLKALEAARSQQYSQAQQFLMAIERRMRSG